jgi:hypothetical protein
VFFLLLLTVSPDLKRLAETEAKSSSLGTVCSLVSTVVLLWVDRLTKSITPMDATRATLTVATGLLQARPLPRPLPLSYSTSPLVASASESPPPTPAVPKHRLNSASHSHQLLVSLLSLPAFNVITS